MGFGDKKRVQQGLSLAHAAMVIQLKEAGHELPHNDGIYAMAEKVGLAALAHGGSVDEAIELGRAMWLKGYGNVYEIESFNKVASEMLARNEALFREVAGSI